MPNETQDPVLDIAGREIVPGALVACVRTVGGVPSLQIGKVLKVETKDLSDYAPYRVTVHCVEEAGYHPQRKLRDNPGVFKQNSNLVVLNWEDVSLEYFDLLGHIPLMETT